MCQCETHRSTHSWTTKKTLWSHIRVTNLTSDLKASSRLDLCSEGADLSEWVALPLPACWGPLLSSPHTETGNFQFFPCRTLLPMSSSTALTFNNRAPTSQTEEDDRQLQLYSCPIRAAGVGGWPVSSHAPFTFDQSSIRWGHPCFTASAPAGRGSSGGGGGWGRGTTVTGSVSRSECVCSCMAVHLCALLRTLHFSLVH